MFKITNEAGREFIVRKLALTDGESAGFELGWFIGVNNIEFVSYINENANNHQFYVLYDGENKFEIAVISNSWFSVNGTRYTFEQLIDCLIRIDW